MTHTGRGKQKASFFVAQLDLYMCPSSQHFSIDKVGPKVQQNTLETNCSAKIGAVSILRNYFGHTKVQVSMLECYLMPYFDNLIPMQSSLTLLWLLSFLVEIGWDHLLLCGGAGGTINTQKDLNPNNLKKLCSWIVFERIKFKNWISFY